MTSYEIVLGQHRIGAGERLPEARSPHPSISTGPVWTMPPAVHSARSLVDALDILLESVIVQLGVAADRASLLGGLEASLSTSGPEAVLPLEAFAFSDPARRELTEQARRIGMTLMAWAREANASGKGSAAGRKALRALSVRSPCAGYQWTGPVIAQLMGTAGSRTVMQLYNEWLHQFILLRDALLPFLNWQDVPLEVGRSGTGEGMRLVEAARERFVGKLLTQRIAHTAIVDLAQSVFDPTPAPEVTYGFQTSLGYALPAAFGRRLDKAPRYLLVWHNARLVPAPQGNTVHFTYGYPDYLAAPTSRLAGEATHAIPAPAEDARIVPIDGEQAGSVHLDLVLGYGGQAHRIDLGQALRGHRFIYLPGSGLEHRSISTVRPVYHDVATALSAHGLVTAENGVHVIMTGGDPLLELALLGKLLPENVVLRHGEDWRTVLATGKGFAARLVLDAGELALS